MTMALYIDREYVSDLSTNEGWMRFSEWVDSLDAPSLREFVKQGWAIADHQLLHELGQFEPPNWKVAGIRQRLLVVLGQIGDLIIVSDGTSDLSIPGVADFANDIPLNKSKMPTREDFSNKAISKLNELFSGLATFVMEYRNDPNVGTGKIDEVIKEIIKLRSISIFAGRVLGMVSPWAGKLSGEKLVDLALDDAEPLESETEYPFVSAAVDFLKRKQIVTAEQLKNLEKNDKTAVFSAPGFDDILSVERLKKEVIKSFTDQESMDDFRKRIQGVFNISRHGIETLYRTNTKQAYVNGMDQTLSTPEVDAEFPYCIFETSDDELVRDEHEVLDGIVVRRGTKEYKLLKKAAEDWGCRCNIRVISKERGKSMKITTYNELPLLARRTYG